jgi:hypothetical protein
MPTQQLTDEAYEQFFLDPSQLHDDLLCMLTTPLVTSWLQKRWATYLEGIERLDENLIDLPPTWQYMNDRRLSIESHVTSSGFDIINFVFLRDGEEGEDTPALFHAFVGTLGYFPYEVNECDTTYFASFHPAAWIRAWALKDETFDCYMDFRSISEAHEDGSFILATPSITFAEAEAGSVPFRVPAVGDEVVLHYSQNWDYEEFSYDAKSLMPDPFCNFGNDGLLHYSPVENLYATYRLTE